ncbi:MAG: RsmB/NOP family class I SAM-dependent RNA methyltransferase [Verrucomicrobia bacterium]|nr:RsmB/NOP family class I SAM-dependent RNA methyltransferase [Verrucomicrobiota bacterium]
MAENKALAFRQKHLISLLEGYERQSAPIDFFVSSYFRANRALGSKDRASISEDVYHLIRWKALLDYQLEVRAIAPTWRARAALRAERDPKEYFDQEEIPLHIRVGMPQELFTELTSSWGEQKAVEIALVCNEQAPTFVRVNALKTTREELLAKWQAQGYFVSAGKEAGTAICFHKKLNFFTLPEFTQGLFEVQDEGSQRVAELVQAEPGQKVLDFCAGSGGKTLAFAPRLLGKGQIFLHDIRAPALREAKKRLKRAGIQNAQTVLSEDLSRLKMLKKSMDWVVVDAPCSGTGTLRRNPDMKFKFSQEMLSRLVSQQRVIFEKALSFVRPKGHILYITCSILKQENREQVEHFLRTLPIEQVGEPFETIPESGKRDGFFAVLFKRKDVV